MKRLAVAAVLATAACQPAPHTVAHRSHELPKPDHRAPVAEAADVTVGLDVALANPPRATVRRVARSKPRARVAAPAPATRGGCSLEDIKRKESGGRYDAQNPRSTASGAYQVLDGTWNGYQGYRRASDAPPEVQDQFARELYARRGSQPWVVCR